METVVDFGDLQVFEGVTTYPAILTLRRMNGHSQASDLLFLKQTTALPDDLSKEFETASRPMPRSRLGTGSWRFEDDSLDTLRRKLTSGRPTLSEVYGPILYGIKTGCNDAFVLDRATRDALLEKDASSAALLKPFLVGEDLKRWRIESDDKWLIYTPKNRIDIDEYPAIREHLQPFKDRLERRATKQKWFELQQAQASCEPWFRQEKLVYPEMSQGPKFSFDTGPHYVSNKVFHIGTKHRGLVALLGSKPLWLIMFGETSPLRGGQWRLELREHRMRALPIFRNEQLLELAELAWRIQDTHEVRRNELIAFMDRAADLVHDGPRVVFANWSNWDFGKFRGAVRKATTADIPVSERDEWEAYFGTRKLEVAALDTRIGDLENEINDRVYRLFDLNTDEIALIEEALEGQY